MITTCTTFPWQLMGQGSLMLDEADWKKGFWEWIDCHQTVCQKSEIHSDQQHPQLINPLWADSKHLLQRLAGSCWTKHILCAKVKVSLIREGLNKIMENSIKVQGVSKKCSVFFVYSSAYETSSNKFEGIFQLLIPWAVEKYTKTQGRKKINYLEHFVSF